MTPALLSFSLIAVFVTSVFGQTNPRFIDWQSIFSADDGFSVDMPKGVSYARLDARQKFPGARAEFNSEGTYLYLFVDPLSKGEQVGVVEKFLRANNHFSEDSSANEEAGIVREFKDSDGYFHWVAMIKSPVRLVAFHALSRSKGDAIVHKFLKSASVTNGVGGSWTPFLNISERTEITDRNPGLMTPEGPKPSQKVGDGSGSGSGNGPSAVNNAPKPERVIVPMKVISKVKAQYTDFARFYNISGDVTLRVTFLASGNIGSVTVIRSLPFGLTGNSRYAARQMKFEPETVNRVARTTARPVVFKFNFY